MLTGDKLETAENIAISCKLIQGDMTVMRLAETNKESVVNKIKDNKETFELCMNEKRKKCLLVEGGSLAIVLDDPKLTDSFVFIS
jgi:phospholipid-transporting ATPase